MKKFFLRSKLDFPWHNLRPKYISSFHLGYRKPVFRLKLYLTSVTGAGAGSHRGVPRTALLLMLWPKEYLNRKDLCGKGCEKSLVALVFGIKPGCYSSFPKHGIILDSHKKSIFFILLFPSFTTQLRFIFNILICFYVICYHPYWSISLQQMHEFELDLQKTEESGFLLSSE